MTTPTTTTSGERRLRDSMLASVPIPLPPASLGGGHTKVEVEVEVETKHVINPPQASNR